MGKDNQANKEVWIMIVYMEISKDKYELPVAIADTTKELAKIRNVSANTISSMICHCREKGHWCRYVRVEIDDEK